MPKPQTAERSPYRLMLDQFAEELLLAHAEAAENGRPEAAGLMDALGILARVHSENGGPGRRVRADLIEAAHGYGLPIAALDLAGGVA
jgi:hypothetical protein